MTHTLNNSMAGFIPECNISFNGGIFLPILVRFSPSISLLLIHFFSLLRIFLFQMKEDPATAETPIFHY